MRYLSVLCIALCLITSCGGGGSSGGGGGTVFSVLSTVPANNAIDVPIETAVEIHFSKEVDPATVTASTITLTKDDSIACSLQCSGSMVILTPSFPLSTDSTYTVTISGNVKDASGNPLGSYYTWSFVTSENIDTSNYYYQPGPGDEMIYKITRQGAPTVYQKSSFSLEDDDIDPTYHYGGDDGNPHLLEVVTEGPEKEDCTVLIRKVYYTLDGKEIIDDQRYSAEPLVWLFTNVEHSTFTGDEEPELVVAGREYESTIEEILFNHSNPPVEVGARTITTSITPLDIVSVTVPAGTYEALRFATESFSEETIGESTITLTGSGTMWFGRNTGLVKVQMEYTRQKDEEDPETFDYLLELVEINLSGESVSPASMQIAPPAKTVPIQALMKNISHIVHPRLP